MNAGHSMSDDTGLMGNEPMGGNAESPRVTAGGLIRQAREAAGVHIAALAVALKVPVSKLVALEADDFSALPDTVFVRALASSVCRTLKVDPGPVLALLPQSQNPRLAADGAGLNAPMKGASGKASPAAFGSTSPSRGMAFLVLALLVGALLIVFLPRDWLAESGKAVMGSTGSQDAPKASEASVLPAPVPAEPPPPVEPSAAPAPTDVATPAPQDGGTTMAGSSVAAAAPSASASAAAAPVATPAAAKPSELVLRAKGESWVQVRDGTGAIVLQRNLAAGETVALSGSLPLSVVIGRADVTEVQVRGKPLDLSTVARENVARFEVK